MTAFDRPVTMMLIASFYTVRDCSSSIIKPKCNFKGHLIDREEKCELTGIGPSAWPWLTSRCCGRSLLRSAGDSVCSGPPGRICTKYKKCT